MTNAQQSLFATPAGEANRTAAKAFSLPTARKLKADGIQRVTEANPRLIDLLRDEAKRVARVRGWAHVDDLRRYVFNEGLTVPRNLWGAVFAGKGWVKVGEKASDWTSNHSHVSPCWKWEGE